MSRRYSIKLTNVAFHILEGRDLSISFEISPIVDLTLIEGLVRNGLKSRGAIEDSEGNLTIERESRVIFVIDMKARTIGLDLSGLFPDGVSGTLFSENLSDAYMTDMQGSTICLSLDQLKRISAGLAGTMIENARAEAQRIAVTEGLAARRMINEALRDAYRDAILERAKSLGNIVSMTEDQGTGSYRLKLEIN